MFDSQLLTLVGLFLYPSLLPVDVQIVLLDKLLHRDLNDSQHTTNLHLHYDLPSPDGHKGQSLFGFETQHRLRPKDAAIHKPISIGRILEKKLRWVTLGGQYDWTNKIYPDEKPPPFPTDIDRKSVV